MKRLALPLALVSHYAASQESTATRELIGTLGGRYGPGGQQRERFEFNENFPPMDALGDFVRVAAGGCAEMCGSQGYLEPVLVDRRGDCQLLRPQPK